MKHSLRILSFSALLVMAAACSKDNPVISVSGGLVQGVPQENGVTVFRGIPYAAPPVGDLRWKDPQPVLPWEGVKVADTFSPISWQGGQEEGSFYWREFYWEGNPEMSEDCLYLNVWAPTGTLADPAAKIPVAMWIHGGAFQNGYSYECTMDGTEWARRGVIMVTINYRLGVLGFLSHPALSEEQGGVSGNYGMKDQIAAIKWIKENIAQFGGDPDNLTILGQSAGAMSVKNLCISPLSRNLFSKAIIQSGGGLASLSIGVPAPSQEGYDAQGKDFMDFAGYSTLEEMRGAKPEDILSAASRYGAERHTWLAMSPHKDGKVLTEDFSEAVYNRTIADIPYMIGSNSEDMPGLGGPSIDRFAEVRDSLSTQSVYEYLFKRDLPAEDDDKFPTMDGAFHSAELWFMFGTLDNSWRPFTEADHALSERMLDAWTSFAKDGNPLWQPSRKGALHVQEFDIQ